MGKLSKAEQGQIVVDLAIELESLDEDEFSALYDPARCRSSDRSGSEFTVVR
jgi:hypothetical protein